MPEQYEFNERLNMSQGVSESRSVESILKENIPSALTVHQAHFANDRNGTDWWVECEAGKFLSVDCKVREKDFLKLKGWDDLALETWSVVEKEKIGWTRDTSKQTDFVLWLWKDTGRWLLIPFQMLCRVFRDNWKRWTSEFRVERQYTPNHGGYHSECVFVPRQLLWQCIYTVYGGRPNKNPASKTNQHQRGKP